MNSFHTTNGSVKRLISTKFQDFGPNNKKPTIRKEDNNYTIPIVSGNHATILIIDSHQRFRAVCIAFSDMVWNMSIDRFI
jgi:hypothetical protein